MQVTLNIKKRETFVIVIVLLLITIGIGAAGVYINQTSKVGHDANEIGSGTIAGNLVINGTLIAKSDVILAQLPSTNPARNLTKVACLVNSTYCTG